MVRRFIITTTTIVTINIIVINIIMTTIVITGQVVMVISTKVVEVRTVGACRLTIIIGLTTEGAARTVAAGVAVAAVMVVARM